MINFLLALVIGQTPTGCVGSTTVLTYGDSKTVQTISASNNQDIWQDVFVRLAGCRANINIGTGATYKPGSIATNGITVAQRQDIIDADLALVQAVPGIVLFNLGSNDAFGAMPAEAAWKADLAAIWDAMRAKWPSVQIYYSETWRQGQDEDSDTLATWYAAVATGRSYVHLCDNERSWVKGSDDGATMFWDGIHFSRVGAAEKARLAAACLGVLMLTLAAVSLGWVMAGASAADLATTEMALRQPGMVEANPFLQSTGGRLAIKTLGTVAVISVHRELKRRKKHWAAKILAITAIAVWSGAAANNAIRAKR